MIPINRQPGAREIRAFARLWFPLFVGAIGGVVWWRADAPMAAAAIWALGGALAVAVLASAEVARIVFVGLMTLTYPIGLLISTLVLALMFYVVFTPIGWFMRVIGRDPLRLHARDAATHWTPYEQDDGPERAFRQY